MGDKTATEAQRLEALWGGDFGDEYVDRNLESYGLWGPFWAERMSKLQPGSVLEIGCNVGGNLQYISKHVDPARVFGVDINRKALNLLRQRVPHVNAVWSPGREVPFRDRWFDLVLAMGVLIHQPDSTLPLVMNEMARCSRRYVMFGEYIDDETVEVHYRGHEGALFRRPYGKIFEEAFPAFRQIETGHLDEDQGFDDVTWWLFERVQNGASAAPA